MSFTLFFTLTVASLADAVLRDQMEVEPLGSIRTADEPSSTLKMTPEPTKAVTRNHSDVTAGSVLSQALLDPFALCMLLLIACYYAFNQLVPAAAQRKDAPVMPRPSRESDAVSTTSSASKARSRSSRGPDRFALVVNQKLTRLDTADEVFEFALQSAETGRTDIVNCVTAIHRSAKLMGNKPQFERIRVGQDPRLRKLLAQLQVFLHEGGHSPSILARAVGNTSWALAKLQYRPDPADPEQTILADLQRVFVQHAAGFRPEELMNAVWAFAEMNRDKDCAQGEERVLAVAQAACRCVDKFPEFTLQQVVYLSWALARMSSITSVKHDCSEVRAGLMNFTTKIVERCRPDITRLTTKNLAMLSWAAASLHANLGLVDTEGLVSDLLGEIAQHIGTKGLAPFLPGEIASIVWALNKVHVRAPAFFHGFQSHLMANGLRGFSTQDLSTILCAFAKTGCGSDALYNMLGERATAMAKEFNRSEKMMVHWAYTQLPHLTPPKL